MDIEATTTTTTTTTTPLKPTVKDLEFQDVSYTIKERKNYIKVIGSREILRSVSGNFRNGQLTAIMGPSGAGKSSLLNAISGYRTSGISGHIRIRREDSCYITQEDSHQTLLSVEELMMLSCSLKLRTCQNKAELINDILNSLSLNHRRKLTAKQLSGGERKRLSIALEFVANPNIFFLDEPTSGLDEVTAAQCIRLLSKLAHQGRTIVCTIHQPSATILNTFDNIFVLARGQCIYQGAPAGVIPFLRHVQLECPKYYSPADYLIELCDVEESTLIPSLVELTQNGKLMYCVPNEPSNDCRSIAKFGEFRAAISLEFQEKAKRRAAHGLRGNFSRNVITSTDGSLVGGAAALYEHFKLLFGRWVFIAKPQDLSNGFHQFCILFHIMMLKILRARIPLLIQFFHHLMCGLFFGLIFFKLGNQGERMFDHLKFCIGAILMVVYTQVMVPILSYPSEVKIVKKETFNRWYTLTPYYLALNISRIPLQFVLNLTYISMIYWMTGLPEQWWRFALFASVALMTSLIAEGMGLAIGATFNVTNGSAVGPLLIAPFLGLAIYGFDFAAQVPAAMNILMKFSYIRVAVVSLVLTVFGFDREQLNCNEVYCHFSDPRVLLKFLDIERVSMVHQFLLLLMLMLFFRALLFMSLRKRCCT